MFKPKYRILVTSKCFPGDGVIGLGSQLILFIDSVKNYLPLHTWYACDVEAVGKNIERPDLSGVKMNLIGSDVQFTQYCFGIEQFIWGVFLCVDKKLSSQNFASIQLETEDEPFRPVNLNGILIEIRAFDTTYFEVYSEDIELLSKISNIYGVEIDGKF